METYGQYSSTSDPVTADALGEQMQRIERAQAGYADARQNVSAWRDEAKLNLDYVAGHQWDEADVQKLQAEKRPPITFNRVAPYVDAVVGTEIQNREAVSFSPREPGDVRSSGMLGDVVRWVRDTADSEFEESNAFRDVVITGIGCSNTTIDYLEDPDGVIREDRVDPLQMAWPSSATKRNLLDAHEIFRTYILTRNAARAMFPDFEDEDGERRFANHALGFGVADYQKQTPMRASSADRYAMPGSDGKAPGTDEVMIVEWQYWKTEDYYRVAFPGGGKIIDLSAENYREMKDTLDEAGAKAEEFQRRRYCRGYYTGSGLDDTTEIEHDFLPPQHPGFTYKFITGRYDTTRGCFYGLVRPMIDPQNWLNKTVSNILHVLSVNAKGGAFYEQGAFTNQAQAEKKWADPSGLIEVTEGALRNGAIQPRKPAEYPTGLHQFLEFTLAQPSMVTGLNPEFMGQAGVNQPGVLEAQRKQSGLAILSWLFDSMKAYRKDKARLLLFYIQEYIPNGRLIRIVGETGAKYAPMMLDRSVVDYDIVLENAPTSPNQKAHTFATLMQMMPMMVKSGIPLPKEVFLYSDLPTPLAQAFAEQIEQSRKPNPEQQAMQQQAFLMDMRERIAKATKDETQADFNRARAEEVIASIDVELEKIATDRVTKVAGAQTDRLKVEAEIQNPKDVTFN